MSKNLSTPIQYLKGIGPKRAEIFQKLGIFNIEDLIYFFPRRYEDRSNISVISQVKKGEFQTIRGEILVSGARRSFKNRRLSMFEAVVSDDTGKIFCLWFNQPYLKNIFKINQNVILYGKVEKYKDRLQINNPEFEILDSDDKDSIAIGRMVPIYPLTEGITQRALRKTIKSALDEFLPQVRDALPYDIRTKYDLLNLAKSLINIHFPDDAKSKEDSYRRLAFEEFFLYQLPVILRKYKAKQKQGIAHKIDVDYLSDFNRSLDFELTRAQRKVLDEIKKDMSQEKPMQRLLQGEVGSGKTIVACFAALIALADGWQVGFMVPTEILARQHYQNLLKITEEIRKKHDFNICILSGGMDKEERDRVYKDIRKGKAHLVVGTHSLIQEDLAFKNLGLVIIDEQHKFGVAQRALLPKKGNNPDILIMTATPIPRTLSLTIYGDLDISSLDELPAGRLPIKTNLYNDEDREEVYAFLESKIKDGRQAYVVYPIIDESFYLDLRGAKEMHKELSDRFKNYKVALLHGQMKQDQQDKIMREFKSKKINILVATSVLEVGVDVANVSVLVIEHADRFGLSQLHQLRGRIGRGKHQSHCILIATPKTQAATERINAITGLTDGFRIAEEDLRIRGPGEFFGRRQSGLSELRIANPISQMHLLKQARDEAGKLIREDPTFSLRQNTGLKDVLKRRFPEYEELMLVG